MRDWHTDAPRVPLSDERLAEIEAEALAQTEAAEVARAQAVVSGGRCSCCDCPIPGATGPTECNDCQNI